VEEVIDAADGGLRVSLSRHVEVLISSKVLRSEQPLP